MRKLIVFSIFALLHAGAWASAHIYRNNNPEQVLVVADTSYALKPSFPDMQRWIEDYETASRYREIRIATDKAMIGPLKDIASRESIFRTAFGRSDVENFARYQNMVFDQRILLSDGSFKPPAGWQLVVFE